MRHFLRDIGRFLMLLGVCLFLIQTCQCTPLITWEERVYQPKVIYRNVYVSEDFTSSQVEDIADALNEWQEKTHGAVHFNVDYRFNQHFDTILTVYDRGVLIDVCSPIMDAKIRQSDERLQKKAEPGWVITTHGYYDYSTPIPTICIVQERIASRLAFTSVVEHEIGHDLGLKDNEIPDTLMNGSQNEGSRHITHQDLEEFCGLHYCDPSVLK